MQEDGGVMMDIASPFSRSPSFPFSPLPSFLPSFHPVSSHFFFISLSSYSLLRSLYFSPPIFLLPLLRRGKEQAVIMLVVARQANPPCFPGVLSPLDLAS